MNRPLIALLAAACVATPCFAQLERFTSDKPSPLKHAKPGKQDGNAVRFSGSVQISGQFLVIWERSDRKPVYRRVLFFPDHGSAALLPHVAGSEPVQELLFSNPEQAAPMLLDLATVQTALAQEKIGSEGAATVTIRDYRAVVDCDHRWYLAQLVSAKTNPDMVASARGNVRPGC